jgi:hypothetical protein
MRKWFRRLLVGVGVFSTYTVLLFLAAMFLGGSGIYRTTLIVIGMVPIFFILPLLVLGIIVTGIGTLLQGKQDSKQKRDFMPYDDYGMQDARLERIMKQISPQDRAYLERRLADQEVGLGNDGEIISMDDLLNEYEEKSKRD